MSNFEDDFANVIKEIEEMLKDMDTQEKLNVLTEYQERLVLGKDKA